ncbi:ribosomal protein S18-alanine N-acetyltransferase [Selenihalanaerobacter shriftii]|uniref:[Ribosomal protein bS18]-alanine N-acetyltransferase n=1 Tax=Selenihalanaerobacter shriftii TaxID=142842 RepID=A0A1T4JW71_9FIRM|nr:ribosomal protein S18-alanine N-acetyltransferase [Selenihalanaerobacter shriftii]SJZ34315.1 ribosomal-protein-alanine N-acetyltransferase [Selenihalanaerobacter shriftii]
MKLIIEPMQVADLDQVLEIEKESFSSPWSIAAFKKELIENQYAEYLVAKRKEDVLGYVGVWIILNEAHITTLAVESTYRRKGIARLMLSELFVKFANQGLDKITLEVRVSNHPGRELYKDYGFIEAGVRKNYYQDNKEDAVIMWKILNQ